VDEEMVSLMAQQQAYGAAAKIITMADEMMRTLLQTL
jgi:flagellar hook-associated protein FlgK